MDTISEPGKKAAILNLPKRYSHNKSLGAHFVENALHLASGRLPLAILMQEPCNIADVVPYEMILETTKSKCKQGKRKAGSPTLQEVEDIIHDASHGKLGLQDVSLLCPSFVQERNDFTNHDLEEAQKLCLQIIRPIESKVVLILPCMARQSVSVEVLINLPVLKARTRSL